MDYRASRVTRYNLSEDRVFASETVTVFGIIVANSDIMTAEVDIEDVSGNKKITVTVEPCTSEIVPFEWVADDGITVDSIGSSLVFVTIFHSSGGA